MRVSLEGAQSALAAALEAEAEAAEWAGAVAARIETAKSAVATSKAELAAAKTADADAKAAARAARSARVNAKEVVQAIETDAQMLVYAAQHWVQLTNPHVLAARPFRRWSTANDERVCSVCLVMHGVTWRADNPEFADVVSPRAFGCRCRVLSLSAEGVIERQCVVSTHVPAGFSVEPGYGIEGIERVLSDLTVVDAFLSNYAGRSSTSTWIRSPTR